MNMYQKIETSLQAAFAPESLAIIDESHQHAGHAGARAGGETHFSVTIVSNKFKGVSRAARHRMVYQALKNELAERVHALSIKALTSEEIAIN